MTLIKLLCRLKDEKARNVPRSIIGGARSSCAGRSEEVTRVELFSIGGNRWSFVSFGGNNVMLSERSCNLWCHYDFKCLLSDMFEKKWCFVGKRLMIYVFGEDTMVFIKKCHESRVDSDIWCHCSIKKLEICSVVVK